MTDDFLNDKQKKFKEKILQLERESIASIIKVDDRTMASKIIRMFEDEGGVK